MENKELIIANNLDDFKNFLCKRTILEENASGMDVDKVLYWLDALSRVKEDCISADGDGEDDDVYRHDLKCLLSAIELIKNETVGLAVTEVLESLDVMACEQFNSYFYFFSVGDDADHCIYRYTAKALFSAIERIREKK